MGQKNNFERMPDSEKLRTPSVLLFSEKETICLQCRRTLMCQKYWLPETSLI